MYSFLAVDGPGGDQGIRFVHEPKAYFPFSDSPHPVSFVDQGEVDQQSSKDRCGDQAQRVEEIAELRPHTSKDQRSTSDCTEGAQGLRNKRGFTNSSQVSEKFRAERRQDQEVNLLFHGGERSWCILVAPKLARDCRLAGSLSERGSSSACEIVAEAMFQCIGMFLVQLAAHYCAYCLLELGKILFGVFSLRRQQALADDGSSELAMVQSSSPFGAEGVLYGLWNCVVPTNAETG